MQRNKKDNNDESEYIELEKLAKELKPGQTILALSESDEDNIWNIIIAQQEGFFIWELNTKSLVTLKNLIEIYNENDIIIDTPSDNVMLTKRKHKIYYFELEINNKSLPISNEEKKQLLNLINEKLNDN